MGILKVAKSLGIGTARSSASQTNLGERKTIKAWGLSFPQAESRVRARSTTLYSLDPRWRRAPAERGARAAHGRDPPTPPRANRAFSSRLPPKSPAFFHSGEVA